MAASRTACSRYYTLLYNRGEMPMFSEHEQKPISYCGHNHNVHPQRAYTTLRTELHNIVTERLQAIS